jgi:hypothetical protein
MLIIMNISIFHIALGDNINTTNHEMGELWPPLTGPG